MDIRHLMARTTLPLLRYSSSGWISYRTVMRAKLSRKTVALR